MKKLIMIMCALLLVFCAKKKTTVETEGLEEVLVFGEEGAENVSEEPVLPEPVEEEVVAPPTTEEEPVLPPPTTEEEIVSPPIIEEEPILPPVTEEEVAVAPPPIVEETLPPMIEEPYVPTVTPPPTTTVPPSHAPAQVLGFRIQIFASSTEGNASRVADDARSSFNENVYVNYIAPYYKVRVGNCLTREEAEVLKNKARTKGYRGAFVVETMISP